jgi:cytochrome-b5 reductase
VFSEEWSKATLLERKAITHDTHLLTFGLPKAFNKQPLGLSTCACLLAKVDIESVGEGQPREMVVRPYTPVSTNALIGRFQLLIKAYKNGKMTGQLAQLAVGDDIEFKHTEKNVKIQYPFGKKHITMIAGGTGITPIIQALHAILGTPGDTTEVTLLFGNKTQEDMLGKSLLESWELGSGGRLKVVHILCGTGLGQKGDSSWPGLRGHVNRQVIEHYAAPPSADTMIFICGPAPMYNTLCGPRDAEELTGVLDQMGYTKEQVFKF